MFGCRVKGEGFRVEGSGVGLRGIDSSGFNSGIRMMLAGFRV